MVKDIQFHPYLEHFPEATMLISQSDFATGSGKVIPHMPYIGGYYQHVKNLMRNPKISPETKKQAIQTLKKIHEQFGNTLSHESLHEALFKVGGFQTSASIDKPEIFGYTETHTKTGLAPYSAIERAMRRAKE